MKEKVSYNLYSTERRYRNETLVTYYFQANKKIIKRWKPYTLGNGETVRLNIETGEVDYYKKNEILAIKNCSLRRTVILMNMLLNMNDFDWFWTITFDKQKIDRRNEEAVFNCYVKYIDNLKHQFPSFSYMTFPERHDDGCFHLHMLVAGLTPKQMGLVNSGKVCCHWATKRVDFHTREKIGYCSREYFEKTKHLHELKETDGETIYNATSFSYGFTTVSRIVSRERCNSYVKKYVEKALGSTTKFKKRFYYSKNLKVPTIVKKLIGADFEEPINLKCDNLDLIDNNPYVENSKGQPYISDYNTLQIKIDNNLKDSLDKGFVPIKINLNGIFNDQMSIFDKKLQENYE